MSITDFQILDSLVIAYILNYGMPEMNEGVYQITKLIGAAITIEALSYLAIQ